MNGSADHAHNSPTTEHAKHIGRPDHGGHGRCHAPVEKLQGNVYLIEIGKCAYNSEKHEQEQKAQKTHDRISLPGDGG